MKKRIKIRRDLKDLQLKKSTLLGAVIVFLITSIFSYAFFFCIRETCALFTGFHFIDSVIILINPISYAFYNFLFAAVAFIFGINTTFLFLGKLSNSRHYQARKIIRRASTENAFLTPNFLHLAIKFLLGISIVTGWSYLFNSSIEVIFYLTSILLIIVLYFHSWNAFVRYYPKYLPKVIAGFFLFLLTSFLLSLWLPINKSEINEKILPTYTQYQMAIELPRTDVLKYIRRRNHVGNIFISKSGEYKEEIRSIDTSDILIPIPSSMMINFSYLSIVADAEVKMKEITTIKKIYMDAPVRQYCFATENPEFPPEANIYRKHFGRGRLFVFGLKNPMPSGINYPAKEELSTFLKENPDYDFSKNLATETFIRLKKDSFLIDNEWLTKDKFAEKLKEKLNPEQGFSFFIDGDLNVQEFIWYMDEVQSNKLKNLFLTLDFEEYEFLKMQKKASNTSQVGGQYFTK